MEIQSIKTPIFKEREPLEKFLINHLPALQEGDVLVITSKIVALSEGRTAKLKDKEKIIRKESDEVIDTPWAALTKGPDGWGINAGVDESNAKRKLILLPQDSFKTAERIQREFRKYYSLRKLGVLITDTRSLPLRKGTVGRALGFAGFLPIKSYIGRKDLFGRKSRVTESNHADALAAAAVFAMGEGAEQTPIVIVRKAPVTFVQKPLPKKFKDLSFPPEKDIFSKVFTNRGRQSSQSSKQGRRA